MRQSFSKALLKHGTGIAALLLTIFAAELAIMELFSPLFARLEAIPGALVDASVVMIISGIPLWFFFVRPIPPGKGVEGELSPALLLMGALAGIFLAEYLVMLCLPQLSQLTGMSEPLLDAACTTVAASFFIWRFLRGLQRRVRRKPLLDSPLRLFAVLLCTLFLVGLLEEVLLPKLMPGALTESAKIAEALFIMLCGAPFIWLLVVRPLRSEARSEKARIAAVHAQVIDGIIALDQNGTVTSLNPAAEMLFGYEAQSIIGTSAAVLFEEGAAGLEELLAVVSKSTDHPLQLREIRCRRRDGSTMFMNVSISELQLEEEQPDYLLIMRDMTLRKEMEQALLESETRFRQIFHQTEDAIIFFKQGGCVPIDANANAERIFGFEKEQLLERGLELFAGPEALPALVDCVSGIAGGPSVQHDFLCRRGDGARIVVSMRGKTMVLQGVPVTYCTFRDITERVRTEERTREIQSKLIQTNKMTSLGLLVSGVAHEINNPNNFIMANAELLKRISQDSLKLLNEYRQEHAENGEFYVAGIPFGELGEHWMRLLDGMLDGSRRVNDIVNNLKGFARQERNQVRCEVEVNQVVRAAVTLMHHELIKFTDNFNLELAEALPSVTGHSQQLGQVVINLLMNACQALPDRKKGVRLATSHDLGRGEVVITVRDEGRGMSREEGQRVMEQFFTTKLDSGGTGLGLSISESIVKEHGGRLEFTSEPGKGTTFFARIPVAGTVPATGQAAEAATGTAAARGPEA